MSLIIAAAQSASVPGIVSFNVSRHLRFITLAAEQGVQLLVFPELSLTGYELSLVAANAIRPDSVVLEPFRQIAIEARMTIVAGAPVPVEKDRLYLAALIFEPDGAVSTYSKVHTHSSEEPVFTPGIGGPDLRVGDTSVALAICRDARQPPHAAQASERGAGLYAVGAMVTPEEYASKIEHLENHARTHRMAVLLANYGGGTGGVDSAGKSAIWSEEGNLVTASTGCAEELIIGRKHEGVWSGTVLPVSYANAKMN